MKMILLLNVKHDSRTGVLLSFDLVVITSAFMADMQRTHRDMFGCVAWRQCETLRLIIVQQDATYSVYYISLGLIIVQQHAIYSVYYIFCWTVIKFDSLSTDPCI